MFAVVGVAAADGELDLVGHMVVGVGEDGFLPVARRHVVIGDELALIGVGPQHLLDRRAEDRLDEVGQIGVNDVGVVGLAGGVEEAADNPGEPRIRVGRGEPELFREVVLGDAVFAEAVIVGRAGDRERRVEEEEVLIDRIVGIEPVLAPDI